MIFDALNAWSVEFIGKPNANSPDDVKHFIYELIDKIKIAAKAKVVSHTPSNEQDAPSLSNTTGHAHLIAIGASTGGTEALSQLLQALPAHMPGMVVVQHIPPGFSRMFAERLNQTTPFMVKEAQTGEYIEPMKILIAPGDKHLKIKKEGDRYKVTCFPGEKVSGHCPSVDVLFDSVAKEAGRHAVGIILTGMGYDGAKGLLAMRRNGARTIGQDEASSVVYGMPKTAFNIGAVEKQASLSRIPTILCSMLFKD
ncbi:CheB methylesterase domain-containing protein [Neobacillus endophyticus]|uniref:CheB methylesterase domain-containing protein n=1 Tax=Neobacillus endophyticus TaxID=2738405 RepID=UPI001C25D990|nr:CheB methylesterase domain-containing protein [Neobacillus endophyticus]